MSKQRRTFERDRKATILKKYLVDKVPISDLCDEYGIKPNHIYNWQKILFDNAEAAFEQATGRGKSQSGQISRSGTPYLTFFAIHGNFRNVAA